jgi:hypothetical protein
LRQPNSCRNVAWQAGVGVVVVIRRENVLAREVSAFEQAVSKSKLGDGIRKGNARWKAAALDRFGIGLIQKLERVASSLRQGIEAARESNATVVEMTMSEVTANVCDAVQKVVIAIIGRGWQASIHSPSRWFSSAAQHCHEIIRHTTSSDRQGTPGNRVGDKAWLLIKQQLRGSDFEWMLDLSAARKPPPRVVNNQVSTHDQR